MSGVAIKGIEPSTRRHLSCTQACRVYVRPEPFGVLSIGTCGPLLKIKRVDVLALGPMRIYMKLWDEEQKRLEEVIHDPHLTRQSEHSRFQVSMPLARNVITENDVCEDRERERVENKKIHVRISVIKMFRALRAMEELLTFLPFVSCQAHFFAPIHGAHKTLHRPP